MKVRDFDTKTDYVDVAAWWKKQDWPAMPLDILSPKGFISEKNDVKLAATWIYRFSKSMYLMEWTVGNPDISFEDREEGIRMVTNKACDWAKLDGAKHVLTMTKHNRLIDKFKNYGFNVSDTEMTHLIRSL